MVLLGLAVDFLETVEAQRIEGIGRPVIVITATVERAHNITEQLPVWAPDVPAFRFAEPGHFNVVTSTKSRH